MLDKEKKNFNCKMEEIKNKVQQKNQKNIENKKEEINNEDEEVENLV